ncbi:MAG: 1-deoxy-D-xylulose-5-phosphate synthase [Muribaculaceae bacterium]|nr:1-deoxy-D-xylulose-5-phosphate synthase [Muribaculaceae bacterium]
MAHGEDEKKENLTEGGLLDRIKTPADLRRLAVEQLPQVCGELREYLIRHLSSNPGHFASSMGAIDIIVALHYVFDTPTDNLVWDVGHQAYAHKILTGRKDDFPRQRTKDGISGFPNPLESPYDTFVAGHAGNSISAALGMAVADMSNPQRKDCKTVAVIGDASIGNGLAFEGLNNASNQHNNLLIVLNDNDMSIDPNVGALHRYLSQFLTSKKYNRFRFRTYNYFKRKGYISDTRKGRVTRLTNSLKAFISKQQNIFEGLNIRYFGPFDGHDVVKLVKILREVKEIEGPRLLHLHTVKGKGYEVAEANPTTWHAPGKFDPETGIRQKELASKPEAKPEEPLWQDVFGETLVELAKEDDSIVGVTAAMPSGTSISKMMKAYPERGFDVGISEGHAVTFAGGLAKSGKRPFVAIYSSFLQRAYDNIIHDVAIQGLPVVFCIDRAGLVGEDGVTHHGLFDLAYLRLIPGMKVTAPGDGETLRDLMLTATTTNSPMAIRYPRGKIPAPIKRSEPQKLQEGKGRQITNTEGARYAILSIGATLHSAKEAAKRLNQEGTATDLYDMIWLKPLDTGILDKAFEEYDGIVTVEDGTTIGGFGSAVAEYMVKKGHRTQIEMLGIDDRWMHHATVPEQKKEAGIDGEAIIEAIKRIKERSGK